jgi:2-keto-4-pentenoate hydratase/2-oxohepta-3-ene-1,7-dioic acid hydratase in catechol pathway
MPGFEFGSPSRKLKAGDTVEGEIERIGRLVVPVRPEPVEVTPPPAG